MRKAMAALLVFFLTVLLGACTVLTPGTTVGTAPAARTAAALQPAQAAGDAGVLQTAAGTRQAGTLKVERELSVGPDGKVQEWRRLVATAQLADAYRRQARALPVTWRGSWQVATQDAPDHFQVTMSREFPDLAAFNQELDGKLEWTQYPLFEQVTFRDALESPEPAELSQLYPGPSGTTPEQWATYLGKSITLTYRISLPGQVTGGNMTVAGNSAVWESAIGSLHPGVSEVTAVSRIYNLGTVTLSIGFVAAMVVLAVGGLFWRRRVRTGREDEPSLPPETPTQSA